MLEKGRAKKKPKVHSDEYTDFYSLVDLLLAQQSRQGTWADNEVIAALSLATQTRFIIFRDDQTRAINTIPPLEGHYRQTVYLYYNGSHYEFAKLI